MAFTAATVLDDSPGALLRNVGLKYLCKYEYLRTETTDTPFTNLMKKGQRLHVPIGHGDGNFFADAETLKRIEGNFSPGDSVVVVDDVITTGGSTIQAIDAIEEAGGRIAFVIALVDRQEGGRENIEKRGHKVVPIFTRAELTGADARQRSHIGIA